jgi:hypothetical protein
MSHYQMRSTQNQQGATHPTIIGFGLTHFVIYFIIYCFNFCRDTGPVKYPSQEHKTYVNSRKILSLHYTIIYIVRRQIS